MLFRHDKMIFNLVARGLIIMLVAMTASVIIVSSSDRKRGQETAIA